MDWKTPEKYNTPMAVFKFAAVTGIILSCGWFLFDFIRHINHSLVERMPHL